PSAIKWSGGFEPPPGRPRAAVSMSRWPRFGGLERIQFRWKLNALQPFCVVAFSDGKPGPTFPENALFQGHHRGDVDLQDHARPGELAERKHRMGGPRVVADLLPAAVAVVRLVANVGEIADHLHDVAQHGAVLVQQP